MVSSTVRRTSKKTLRFSGSQIRRCVSKKMCQKVLVKNESSRNFAFDSNLHRELSDIFIWNHPESEFISRVLIADGPV